MNATSVPVTRSFAEFNAELVRLDNEQGRSRKGWIDWIGIIALVVLCLLFTTALILHGLQIKISANVGNWLVCSLVGSEFVIEVCAALNLSKVAVTLRKEGRFGFLDKQTAVEDRLAETMARDPRKNLKHMEKRLGVEMEMLDYRGEILTPAAAIIGILLGLIFKNIGDIKSNPYPALILNALLAADLIVLVLIAERRQRVRRMMWIARKSAKLAKIRPVLDKSESFQSIRSSEIQVSVTVRM